VTDNSNITPGPLPSSMQLTADGKLKHFLTVEGLPPLLLEEILDRAQQFVSLPNKAQVQAPLLRGKTVMNLFFENSTRTRTTFELAAKRLSADLINLDIRNSATTKGESLLDTIRNLEAMGCDMFVVRHPSSGAANFIAQYCAPHISVLNAGDGNTRTQPKRCWICSQSASTKAISHHLKLPSSET
jgi:aspartate carbamoyltransferase catalytic subunit